MGLVQYVEGQGKTKTDPALSVRRQRMKGLNHFCHVTLTIRFNKQNIWFSIYFFMFPVEIIVLLGDIPILSCECYVFINASFTNFDWILLLELHSFLPHLQCFIF